MQQKMLKQMNVMDKEAEAEDEALADLASVRGGPSGHVVIKNHG